MILLGDFTKMERTQMEMFHFLWLIWDNYLPLTPTKNDWPFWYPQGGLQIYPKGKFTTQNHEHKSTLDFVDAVSVLNMLSMI